ncbi:hypothetical protein [Stygiolobus caldivivus]|uniref:DsrE family protein n=1 Tax=Stygiolobus caldivivus TaxID=2824673 RepID=A0A8D5U4X7_9CREN|nr:hypothetical protein [Stygiolobus caldivivus]BCU69348.1 hypothetical protein KN1_06450 [Stygiolobus caldivivus]
MAKVLFLIMSDDSKFEMGLRMAYNSYMKKRYEDVKVAFFGPSQKRLPKLEGEMKEMLQKLLDEHVIDSACIGVAKNEQLIEALTDMGLRLEPMGDRVAHYVNQGYIVITF